MAQAGKDASPAGGAVRYARHRPETTLLYQLVDEYYPAFADQMAAQGAPTEVGCIPARFRYWNNQMVFWGVPWCVKYSLREFR